MLSWKRASRIAGELQSRQHDQRDLARRPGIYREKELRKLEPTEADIIANLREIRHNRKLIYGK